MAAFHTLAPSIAFLGRAASHTGARRIAVRRHRPHGLLALWPAIAPLLACLWAVLALGLSGVILAGLILH